MALTFDVSIWEIEVYNGKRGDTYRVRWRVGRLAPPFKETYKIKKQAEAFRANLIAAAARGEAFDDVTGRPVSMARNDNKAEMSWFHFACAYVDLKWDDAAGNSRKGVAETLSNVTPHMLTTRRGKPDAQIIRRALTGWAFNLGRRETTNQPDDIMRALAWLRGNTRPVSVLAESHEIRSMLKLAASKLDGTAAATATQKRKRAVLYNTMEYAVELGLLDVNPIDKIPWKAPKPVRAIDKRVVVNPAQAAQLLLAVNAQQPSGPQIVTFFAVMYYSGLRPGEAVNLRRQDLVLPEHGWGELLLWQSAPETGASWSSTGARRDKRQLKHRDLSDTRPVPSPPILTALLRLHLRRFGTDEAGYLFRGIRDTGQLSESTYSRAWRNARKDALTDDEYESPMARRAYHLRHACLSTWLNGGVAPTQVAEWAGHSVAVLLQVYAQCISGQQDLARKRIEEALGEDSAGSE